MAALSEQVYSLLVVGAVSGLLIPSLMRFIDLRLTARAEERKVARACQLELLDRLTKVVWEWRYCAKRVAYYGADLTASEADRLRYEGSAKEYDTKVWEQFIEIKAIKSASIVWLNDEAATEVEALYSYLKDDIDVHLSELVAQAGDPDTCREAESGFAQLSERFTNEVSNRIEAQVASMARRIRS